MKMRRLLSMGLAAAIAASPAPPAPSAGQAAHAPGLNHVYVVLDRTTFDAMRNSEILAELLGRTDGGLPNYAPPPADTDRVFFRGRQTYLELFAPGNRFDEPVGKVGLALGEDRADRFEALVRRWQEACGADARRSTAEWTRAYPTVPWYDAVQCDATASGPDLAVWAMVYRPEFHRWQSAGTSAPKTARREILAPRVRAGQGRFDIVGLTLDVPPKMLSRLLPQLHKAGLRRSNVPGGIVMRGSDWRLTLRTAETSGLVSIDVRTRGNLGHEANIGSARLLRLTTGVVRIKF